MKEPLDVAMDRLAREESLLMKPSKVLRTAADLLEQGWCQGALGRRTYKIQEYGVTTYEQVSAEAFKAGATIDRVCLMGALMKAVVDLYGADWLGSQEGMAPWAERTPVERAMTASYLNAEKAVEREIKTRTGVDVGDPVLVAVWNDANVRTHAEVLDVVRVTAAREEEAGR